MILTILSILLILPCWAIRENYFQGKLKWENKPTGFFGSQSYLRKYKLPTEPAPSNWYYVLNDLKYRELFPLSGTLFVWITDCPHFFQSLIFTFMSLAITFSIGWNLWVFVGVMVGVRILFFVLRKITRKLEEI